MNVIKDEIHSINGPTQVNVGSMYSYNVIPPDGNGYNWSVIGGEIQSGQGSDTIMVLFTTPGPGNIGVEIQYPSAAPSVIIIDTNAGVLHKNGQ